MKLSKPNLEILKCLCNNKLVKLQTLSKICNGKTKDVHSFINTLQRNGFNLRRVRTRGNYNTKKGTVSTFFYLEQNGVK